MSEPHPDGGSGPRTQLRRTSPASALLAALLAGAGVAAVVRAIGGAALTRLAAVVVAVLLGWIAAGSLQARPWALGSAFLLGLFWLWAAVALGLQRQLGAGEAALWIGWSVAVIVTSVRARRREESHG